MKKGNAINTLGDDVPMFRGETQIHGSRGRSEPVFNSIHVQYLTRIFQVSHILIKKTEHWNIDITITIIIIILYIYINDL